MYKYRNAVFIGYLQQSMCTKRVVLVLSSEQLIHFFFLKAIIPLRSTQSSPALLKNF